MLRALEGVLGTRTGALQQAAIQSSASASSTSCGGEKVFLRGGQPNRVGRVPPSAQGPHRLEVTRKPGPRLRPSRPSPSTWRGMRWPEHAGLRILSVGSRPARRRAGGGDGGRRGALVPRPSIRRSSRASPRKSSSRTTRTTTAARSRTSTRSRTSWRGSRKTRPATSSAGSRSASSRSPTPSSCTSSTSGTSGATGSRRVRFRRRSAASVAERSCSVPPG